MDMTGEHRINASRQAVWAGLNDPETLKQAIDGIDELNKISDTEFEAVVVAKVGPVKAKFKGKITLSDLDPPNGYTITGEGQGGAAGFAKGGAKVRLEDIAGGATLLKYEAHAQIGGKLAQIGSRLIDGAAHKMADEFFTAFAGVVEAKGEAPPPVVDEPVMPTSTLEMAAAEQPAMAPVAMPPEDDANPSRGLPPVAWIGGLIVIVGAAMWWFMRK